jgi:Icc-related predicted phosphoesterase
MQLEIISDTHSKHEFLTLKGADVLIHCGDFSHGGREEIMDFLEWFSAQEHEHKILIAGNHDIWLEEMSQQEGMKEDFREFIYRTYQVIYLDDDSVTIENLNFYGSPYSVTFYDWAFMESEEELFKRYQNIPDDTHILLTHTPIKGVLDKTYGGDYAGSQALKLRVSELEELKLHCCGHIHESYGVAIVDEVICVNAAVDNWYGEDKESIIVTL